MTVTVDGDPSGLHDTPVAGEPGPSTGSPAEWPLRAVAFAIDVLPGLGLLACALLIGWSAPVGGWLWWLCMVAAALLLLAVALNRLLLPAATGWTLGRSLVGIAVVGRDGRRPGPWQLLARDLAHLADTVPMLLGWFWPLIDRRRRTFADLALRTEVHQVDAARPEWGRPARLVAAGGAALGVVLAALGYFAVYRSQVAAEAARAEIAAEGPTLVTDMLSYTAKTVAEDFTKAQSLVTDAYRPDLAAQQEAVRKAGVVDNDYWVTDSAVLSASADEAAMLLLLQGQRGTPPQQRFLTASVKVSFAKSDAGRWQVAGLTVLAAPKPEAPPPAKPPAGKPPAKPPAGKPPAEKPPAKPPEAKPPAKPPAEKPPAKSPEAKPPATPSPPQSAKPTPKPAPPSTTGAGR